MRQSPRHHSANASQTLPGGPIRADGGRGAGGRARRWATWKGGAGKFSTGFAPRAGNRLARCKIKDPSLQNWPALSEAILGNIIPDFPVVNKSFNLSYSGTDR